MTEANVHDILADCAVTVSIASAVALEGMLHGKPAVLCGRSDLHHCAVTVTRAGEIGAGIEAALGRVWPFDAFLYWFLFERMLNTGRSEFGAQVVARIAAQGVDLASLGLG